MAPYYDEEDEVTWQGCLAAFILVVSLICFLTYCGKINW